MTHADFEIQPLPVAPSLLGESPFWHPLEKSLYWCDIPGRQLNCFQPETGLHRHWSFDCEPASAAPVRSGGLLLAMRDGLWHFDTETGKRRLLASAPYDPRFERFNDGKADAAGRFWVGTLYEPRDPALAALYCYADGGLRRAGDHITTSNGLAWSPDGATMYWTDTKAHTVRAFDFEASTGAMTHERVFATFPSKVQGASLDDYGGRPDGAAVDVEGAYWVAMFEGRRLLRIAPTGQTLQEIRLPVRCATMPCFGDDDWRTLYVTTARENRPPDELATQPLAGCVLRLRVPVPGLPTQFAKL